MLQTCPDELDLYAAIAGAALDESLASHLSSCAVCRDRLSRLKSDVESFREAAEESVVLHAGAAGIALSRDPQTIGKYQVIERLGQGGQAVVYRAMHPTLKHEVIVKIGREPTPPDEADTDWLVNEARLLRDLNHPNLAKVYDLDFHENRPFIVMQYIRGRTLSQISRERAISTTSSALLVAKVARAVDAAHKVGVIHRDITPRNIIIDEAGEPYLIDFGLARLRHAWGEKAEPLGLVAGTAEYMSPEQAEGRVDDIDARTDVYGLGAVLRSLLQQRADRSRDEEPVWSDASIDQSRVWLQPPREDAPAWLINIVETSLKEKREHRFASAAEMADELEASMRPRTAQMGRWATVAAFLVIAAALSVIFWPRAPKHPEGFQNLLKRTDNLSVESTLPLGSSPPVHLSVDLPRGTSPVLAFIDPDGTVELHTALKQVTSETGRFDRYEYWRDGLRIGSMEGGQFTPDPPGTKVIVVLAYSRPRTPDELEALRKDLVRMTGNDWIGKVEGKKLYRISASGVDGVAADNRGTVTPLRSRGESDIEGQLQAFVKKLAELNARYFAGVAVPYGG